VRENSPMKLLAFDTSTESLSIAVGWQRDGHMAVWQHTAAGGPLASSQLIPQIQALLAQAGLSLADLDAIAFGAGPGSFTGLRTACAVAQGLAFGVKLPLLPVDTLMAVAEEARHTTGAQQVHAVLDARMGEVYAAAYQYDPASMRWQRQADIALLAPEALVVQAGWAVAGNAWAACGERIAASPAQRMDALPTATALLRLASGLLTDGLAVAPDQALPLYIRDKVAKTTDERAAERAAAS
jgi:tRNA threonylcarbamoyladenosine biosynthesis protein TsaB